MQLNGFVAVITGGTRGIGKGIAETFLRQGASVAINGRSPEAGEQALAELGEPERTSFMVGDATERADIEALIDGAAARFGRVDVLVNNAGGADNHAPVADLTDEAMDLALRWNLWSTFYGMRHALKNYMIPQGYGRIINISSVEGKEGRPGIASYVTAKHAVHGLTKSAAQEVGTMGITVNAICPGMIETHSVKTQGQSAAAAAGMSYEAFTAQFTEASAVKRFLTVDEVAAMALLLASPAGSGITGAMLSVDGGTASY
jgi:3-hydroxybutyrate dehydrogenase/3-oxoacyl-[acyl-carrier protein] reductase